MKNKILYTLITLAIICFAIGVSLADSTGVWFAVSMCMTFIPVAFGCLMVLANRGRR